MAITWNKIIPRWGGDTIEPPEAKKDTGYIAGDKPPAKWENWLRKGTYEALDETRDVIEGIDSQLAHTVKTSDTANWQKIKVTKDDGQALDLGVDINPDTIINSGFYKFALNSAMYGLQAGTYSLIVSRAVSLNITQILIGTNSAVHNQMLIRSSNSGTWTVWSEVYNSYRHSVIESKGSNANGQWIRFSDGTQICYLSSAISSNASARTQWVYPAAFLNIRNILGTVITDIGTSSNTFQVWSANNTQADFDVVNASGARLSKSLYIIAIGRWK